MKLFVINETEWVAADTQEEAIEFLGLDPDEIKLVEEIPETEWDEEIEAYEREDFDDEVCEEPKPIFISIRQLMLPAIESGKPTKIMSEE
ncbi:MAG: hypothetical protein WC833_08770 [Bacteroidales bacterium]|jgi:hypothetical protein